MRDNNKTGKRWYKNDTIMSRIYLSAIIIMLLINTLRIHYYPYSDDNGSQKEQFNHTALATSNFDLPHEDEAMVTTYGGVKYIMMDRKTFTDYSKMILEYNNITENELEEVVNHFFDKKNPK